MRIEYSFANGEKSEVEISEEIGGVILDMERETGNLERKERYHCYSLDAADFDGKDYASGEDIPSDYIQREENKSLYDALTKLPGPQKRRLLQVADGMSMQEIARKEGVGYYSVYKSIEAARKNIKKFLKNG